MSVRPRLNKFPHVPRAWLALALFCVLTLWHMWPVLPVLHRASPIFMDMGNNTAELLSVMRSVVRHPWAWWCGQYTYPYPYNNALINANFLCGVPYYAIFSISGNPCLAYNVMLLLIFVANGFSVYVLVREWNSSWMAGVFAGALCAFFPHRFHDTVDYHYQVTFMAAFALWAWLRFLRHGGVRRLLVFFAIVVTKAISIDYQTVYLAIGLAIMVPCGFLAYPARLREVWWQLMVCSAAMVMLLVPFYYPYYINMTRLPSIGWVAHLAGCTRLDFISWRHVGEQFSRFIEHVTQLRQRSTYIPDAPLLPGAVALTTTVIGLLWALAVPCVKGRRAVLVWGLLILTGVTVLLTIMPAYKHGETPGALSPLARFILDPPLLGFVRNSRAYIHNVMLCASILAGLALGDLLSALWRWRRRAGWCASACVGILLVLATLEHTVRVDAYGDYVPQRLSGVYAWLSQQAKPSPFIEFPFARNMYNFRQAMQGVLADQPTGVVIGRSWPQMAYFLMEIGNQPLNRDKLALLEASPYRFWVQHGSSPDDIAFVHAHSSLRYETNFGSTFVYRNQQIERTLPLTLSVTQQWNLSFPNIYVISIGYSFTSRFTYVPLRERPVVIECNLLDEAQQSITRMRIRGELPFMLAGPTNGASVHLTYDPVARRVRGYYRNTGHFNLERWPVSSRRCGADIYRTRWIDVRVTQRGTGRQAAARVRVVPIPPRWPYQLGVPVALPHQAAGLDPLEQIDGRPCQRSRGRYSVVCLGAPAPGANTLLLTAKAALRRAPTPLVVNVELNDTALGAVTLAQHWVTYQLRVPPLLWRKLNTIVLRYPHTYYPCLLLESYDQERRCALLAALDAQYRVTTLSASPAASTAPPVIPYVSNLLVNSTFSSGLTCWNAWQHARQHPELITVGTECEAPFVRIHNTLAQLIGLQQTAVLQSGGIYRLRVTVRSPHDAPHMLWGARAAVYLPPQPEHDLVWLYHQSTWNTHEIIFTNHVDGDATVYFHMGYGGVAATADFAEVRLDHVQYVIAPTNCIERISAAGVARYASVVAAARAAQDGDEIVVYPGTYREPNAGAEWLMSHRSNVRIRGIHQPVIEVSADQPGYQISLQLPYNQRLRIEGVILKTTVHACSNTVLYGLVVTGSRDVLISNCVLWADVYSTNSTFKHFVAVNQATNVVIQDCTLVTRDLGANNQVWHAASHDAAPLIFERCTIQGLPRARISIGAYDLRDCNIEEQVTVSLPH